MGEDRTSATGADRRRLTVPQAAQALGVTVDAVRGRIRRGKLDAEHDAGAVYVWIDVSEDDNSRGPSAASQRPSDDQSELAEDLREQVDYLRRQLEQANDRDRENRRTIADLTSSLEEANRENRRVILALTSRIPAIETPQEATEAAETVEEGPERAEEPHTATVESQEGVQRSWWRRVFGG